MEKLDKNINNILITSITPYFLEKQFLWFQENLEKILEAKKSQNFFEDNVIFLKNKQDYNFSQILRKLDEMGYEKVFTVRDPGEFSQKGGVIDIFPINSQKSVRLDFLGNTLENIKLLTAEVLNEKKSKKLLQNKLKSQKIFSDLKNLKPGDYLVHLDHGISKYCGIEKFEIKNNELHITDYKLQEYYVLEYAENDKLYVPVGLEKKLSKYIGFRDPKVSRLTSILWQKTKKKIKEDVEKLAKELLELYAEKEVIKRTPYLTDKEMEAEVKSGFIFEETPDQIQTILDIKNDLSKEKPMDRIVCGDVGFGKTEIAIRTTMLAIANNRQTAIICPTTILANQHFNNFKKRFEKFPIRIALLSRLQNKTEQKKIVKDIKDGKIDVIIGTHRVLSNDVEFKNLQLLIIDDEQRFGVKQKEKLRQIKASLDVLSLSATPIPRTIYLAMSSFKKISLIQTPPQGRVSVKNYILPYNQKIIKKAITEELKRKGQVFYLHNRVQTIEKTKLELANLLPKAKIGFIHGRMPEKKLIEIMDNFQKEKLNVLVATTIIENGIDLPKVNTIIIEDATKLGLSQAYQIRGRVGRSFTQGFAYLFFEEKNLTPQAKDRLNALKEAEELSSGYKIAMRDLELRGAGNILGKEQSGSINKIGLNLYCQVLSEAVEKMRNN
jgi:transcription-repair coupling factor (superfamily II helicase)